MLKVGLTGGIGSGKSTASNYLRTLGAYVFDADKEAKDLIDTNDTVQHELISEFGTDIINIEGLVDKKKLSRVAFQDDDHQERLNAVVHPHVYDLIDASYNKAMNDNKYNIFIVDAALVYESGLDSHLDYVIVVSTSEKIQRERVLKRPDMTDDKFNKILISQIPNTIKCQKADFIIDTSISIDDAEKQALNILEEIEQNERNRT